jgi:hypothetical protein
MALDTQGSLFLYSLPSKGSSYQFIERVRLLRDFCQACLGSL